MRVRPVSTEVLVDELVDLLTCRKVDSHLRVAVDGAPAAGPGELADALVGPLRARGRPALRIDTGDFLRPASVRLEFGRHDPDSYYQGWFDEAGLAREVLDPAGPGGSGRVLTKLWNPATDRAAREPYADLAAGAILLVSGPLLLGGGLAFDVTVHLEMSAAALARRTPPEDAWTLPAFGRYAEEVGPASFADVVVRVDDPRRPAMVLERS
ncbi:uridine kinase [Actinoplanes sp. M2I2]|uniref:uridine kinase n=1 Tax=Actinoplanes sp. M2I2 TaxID=1734444 RepID=UPI002020B704|nr:uridine kinase [Actinoplanes sp. M2I2]